MVLRRTALGWLIPLIFSMSAIADEVNLNPSHPSQYLVVEGDTLWNIAGKFLKKPAQWPRVWKANPSIKNPNLIYPGDVLAFSVVNGKPQISVAQRKSVSVDGDEKLSPGYEKLSPKIRETSITEAIKMLPTTAIDQYLSSPKVVSEHELDIAPYVLSFAGEHLVAGAGDRVYVRTIPESENVNYTIYRKGRAYVDPDNNETLGYEAEFIADASLQKAGDPATLLINKASSEIRSGDRLMPGAAGDITLNYFPRPPEKPVNGSIVGVLGGVSQIGQYNIVVLNKGAQDGLAVGHVLDIVQRGKLISDPYAEDKDVPVQLPDELAGNLMVFRAFERVSYALIMQASQPIHVLDKVKVP
ncbi:MAG: LysM peptidoglycan-binding domain-containing protein [Methylococcaceae bacterium]